MATVKIKSISCQYILNNKDYNWLLKHLDEDLQILSLNFTPTGRLWSIAVYAPDIESCISLFIDENKLLYKVNYNGNSNY